MKVSIQYEPVDGRITSISRYDTSGVFSLSEDVDVPDDLNINSCDLCYKEGKVFVREQTEETPLYSQIENLKIKIQAETSKAAFESVQKDIVLNSGGTSGIPAEYEKRQASVNILKTNLAELSEQYNKLFQTGREKQAKQRDADWKKTIEYRYAICLIIRDENEYLEEWIKHHLSLGFDHLFIYDNNSKIPIRQTVAEITGIDYSQITVNEITDADGTALQYYCYNKFLKDYGKLCKYVAFIDTDEFICLPHHNMIAEFMTEMDNSDSFGAVHLKWQLYNADSKALHEDGLLQNRFTETSPYKDGNAGKCIVKASRVVMMYLHQVELYSGSLICDVLGNPLEITETGHPNANGKTIAQELEQACIKHYFTRSLEEWINKMIRGNCSYFYRRDMDEFVKYNPDMAEIYEQAKKRLFGSNDITHKYQTRLSLDKATVRETIEQVLAEESE